MFLIPRPAKISTGAKSPSILREHKERDIYVVCVGVKHALAASGTSAKMWCPSSVILYK